MVYYLLHLYHRVCSYLFTTLLQFIIGKLSIKYLSWYNFISQIIHVASILLLKSKNMSEIRSEMMRVVNDFVTPEVIDTFLRDGVVVITNVLSSERVIKVRNEFHRTLREIYHVDHDNLLSTAQNVKPLSSTNGAGGILDLFYFDWKLQLNEDPIVLAIMQALWAASYASGEVPHFQHPYGPFDSNKGYMYIDRCCFRLPDELIYPPGVDGTKSKRKTLQRSLTPHLDCCPHEMYRGRKWRPIQAFIALTDTIEPNHGGFEVCKGLHREFDEWIARRQPSESTGTIPCVGQFTPIRPKEDADIIARMEHVPCQAGDLVCWDYRLAHANAGHNFSGDVREVVYVGLLPCIPLNQTYAEEQLQLYQQGQLPIDQWHESKMRQSCDYEFSEMGKRLMTILPW